jgi:hypothetical protein
MALLRRHLLLAGAASLGSANARAQDAMQVLVAGSRIRLVVEPGFSAQQLLDIQRWVQQAALSVAGYLGRLPLPQFELTLQRVAGAGVKGGTTFAEPEPYIRVRLGQDSSALQLADDWVLVHEMVHLAVPRVPRSQNWLHEGIATYVEGVARVQSGLNTAPRLWAELVRGLPKGQPQDGDRGLDHTHTWGRTYWGGALFCLLADVGLLQATAARQGLRHALRGLLAAGGGYAQQWPVRRILETADAAVTQGTQTTLVTLYETMKDSSAPVDLDGLWRRLGVSLAGGTSATLDDNAPLAAVRRAIA